VVGVPRWLRERRKQSRKGWLGHGQEGWLDSRARNLFFAAQAAGETMQVVGFPWVRSVKH